MAKAKKKEKKSRLPINNYNHIFIGDNYFIRKKSVPQKGEPIAVFDESDLVKIVDIYINGKNTTIRVVPLGQCWEDDPVKELKFKDWEFYPASKEVVMSVKLVMMSSAVSRISEAINAF